MDGAENDVENAVQQSHIQGSNRLGGKKGFGFRGLGQKSKSKTRLKGKRSGLVKRRPLGLRNITNISNSGDGHCDQSRLMKKNVSQTLNNVSVKTKKKNTTKRVKQMKPKNPPMEFIHPMAREILKEDNICDLPDISGAVKMCTTISSSSYSENFDVNFYTDDSAKLELPVKEEVINVIECDEKDFGVPSLSTLYAEIDNEDDINDIDSLDNMPSLRELLE